MNGVSAQDVGERMNEVMGKLGLLELRLTRLDSAQMSARALKRVALAAALLLPRPRGNEACLVLPHHLLALKRTLRIYTVYCILVHFRW